MHVREYQPTDLGSCVEIFNGNCPKYFCDHERQEFVDWLNEPDRAPYYLFSLEGDLVACAGIYFDVEQNKAGMAWGMVRSDQHGRGIGRFMTQFRIDRMNELYPRVAQHLGTSQHTFQFYEKMGFEIVNVTPNGFGLGMDRYDMVLSPAE